MAKMITRIQLEMLPDDALAVRRAMRLLLDYAPEHLEHVLREIREVSFSWSGEPCPVGAVACTGGVHGRRVVLMDRPSQIDPIDLAVLLSHEARHHYTDVWGRHFIIAHTCTDCSNPYERAADPIYVLD